MIKNSCINGDDIVLLLYMKKMIYKIILKLVMLYI